MRSIRRLQSSGRSIGRSTKWRSAVKKSVASQTSEQLLAEYSAACNYPGRLDVRAVEDALRRWCQTLGIERQIARLGPDWVDMMPLPLWRNVCMTLDAIATDAMAARDARARSEERRVGKECRSRWSP